MQLNNTALGQKSEYIAHYKKELLFPIPRKIKRDEIAVPDSLPFQGVDVWNAYEISWLNEKGKPRVAIGEFVFPCTSKYIIESKSFKLYLNSLNNTRFSSIEEVRQILQKDLSECVGAQSKVTLFDVNRISELNNFSGICLDDLDIACDFYEINPSLLQVENIKISESVFSHLLKSNCLVTNQPDWGSVQIVYEGNQIQHTSLLKYLVSFRNHNEFHEQCVERIFMDIMRQCKPKKLSVHACYTRRGGLDINPYRATDSMQPMQNLRLIRQ